SRNRTVRFGIVACSPRSPVTSVRGCSQPVFSSRRFDAQSGFSSDTSTTIGERGTMDSRNSTWRLRLIIAAAAAAAVQTPAFAQQTSAGASPKEEPLEEIVVTARYREEKLQEIP